MGTPICVIVGNHSSPATPSPDMRGVYFREVPDVNGERVYKHASQDYYVSYTGGIWVVSDTKGAGGASYFQSATLIGDYAAGGGATGLVGVSDGGEARQYLKEKDAAMVQVGLAGIPRTKQLTRRWDKISDKLTQECQDILYEWTSAENWQEQYYVDNPIAVGERGIQTWPGRWRQVSIGRTANVPQGITETLRLGFQQHSGDSGDPLDQDEARLGKGTGNVVTGDRVYRQDWRYTDPADHEEILADLTGITTVFNPIVEGEEIAGLFACSKIESQPNEDGSILISRTLTEIHTVDDPADLTALTAIETQEEKILNLFGFEPGDEETLVHLYTNVDPASQTYCMETLTAAQLETIAGGTWKFFDRKFVVDKESGAATFAVIYMKETWDATYDDRKVIRGGTLSGWLRNMVLQATGESQAQAIADFQLVLDEVGAAFNVATQYNKGDTCEYSGTQYIFIEPHLGAWDAADVVEAHYLLNGRQLQHRGKGEYVVTGDMVSAYDGTAAGDAIVVRAGDAFTITDRRVGVRVWFRRSYDAMVTLTTPSTGEAWTDWTYDGETYYSHNWAVEDHGNGTYTVRQFGWVLTNDVSSDDGFVTRLKPGITTADQEMIVRSWPNLTEAAKETLIAAGGKARSDYTIGSPYYSPSQLFTHADCFVEDRGEAGYTVRQVLVYLETGTTAGDALVIRIRDNITATQQRVIVRVWATRSEAAKNTLVTATTGEARKDYTFEGTLFSHQEVFVDDRGSAGYTVRQILFELSTDTTDNTALIIRIRATGTSTTPLLQRVWLNRTTAAKNTLTGSGGVARNAYVFETVTYTHHEVRIDDNGSGGYNVTQTLLNYGTGITVGPTEWEVNYPLEKVETRSSDDQEKIWEYTKYIAMRVTEKRARDYIDTQIGTLGPAVSGSDHVVRKGRQQFEASFLILDNIQPWA